MGFFRIMTDLLDENSGNSLEKKITGAIDKVETTLNSTLDKAEDGIKQASTAVDKLNTTASLVEEKVSAGTSSVRKTIEVIDENS